MNEDAHEQALVNMPESNLPCLSIIESIVVDRKDITNNRGYGLIAFGV